jgi:hypothetical protein
MQTYVDLIFNLTYIGIIVWTAINFVNLFPKPLIHILIITTFFIAAPFITGLTIPVIVAIALPANIVASLVFSSMVL